MTFDYAPTAEPAAYDSSGLLERMAGRLGSHARADSVFGDPVTEEGLTVIPVAKVRWGFGGGAGGGGDDGVDGEDFGGGGGGAGAVSATPVGYIEIRAGSAEFRPVRDRAGMWPLVAASGFAVWMTFRGLRALFR
jgi:uncharacterized spore protein YtfJ